MIVMLNILSMKEKRIHLYSFCKLQGTTFSWLIRSRLITWFFSRYDKDFSVPNRGYEFSVVLLSSLFAHPGSIGSGSWFSCDANSGIDGR